MTPAAPISSITPGWIARPTTPTSLSSITTLVDPTSSRKIDPKTETVIETTWQQRLASAKASGKELWDAPRYRLNGLKKKENGITLHVATEPFSVTDTLQQLYFSGQVNLGREYYPMGMYVCTLIATTDQKIMFITLPNTTILDHRVSLIGGTVAPANASLDEPLGLQKNLEVEMIEEVGLRSQDVSSHTLLGVMLTTLGQAGIYNVTRLTIDSETARKRFTERTHPNEIQGLLFVSPSEAPERLKNIHPQYFHLDLVSETLRKFLDV